MPLPAIDRRCHYLTKNKSSKRPSALVFFDCESYIDELDPQTQNHTFRLAVASFCTFHDHEGLREDTWKTFYNPLQLWEWITGIPGDFDEFLIVSHNLDYDMRVSLAFSILPRLGFKPDYCILSESCKFFSFVAPDRKLSCTDNLSLWPATLEEIGKSVGLEKGSVDFSMVNDVDLASYCRNDVEILVKQWRVWLSMLDELDLGNFSITISKQAFNAYRHRFMPCEIGIHNSARAIRLERAAYKGGRAEAFYLGKPRAGEYYQLDVNSLYPYMMKLYPYPALLVKVVENVTLPYLDKLLGRYLAIADVAIETDQPMYVVERDGTNLYPVGSFFTTLTTPELQVASMLGHIRGIGQVALYKPAYLFSSFVDTFYSLRQECLKSGDVARGRMIKLLMNGLQGKFGQVGHQQEVIGQAPMDLVSMRRWVDLESSKTCVDVTFGGQTMRQIHGGEPYDSFPAIPAHVAAYARLWMYDLREKAGRDHVYYMDTDSLIVDRAGLESLRDDIDKFALGKLKLLHASNYVEIIAKKHYIIGGKETIKGIKADADCIGDATYGQWHYTTLKWGLQTGSLDNVRVNYVERTIKARLETSHQEEGEFLSPPHISVRAVELEPYLERDKDRGVWTWEFDTGWVKRVVNRVSGKLLWVDSSRPKMNSPQNLRLHSLLPGKLCEK